MTLQLQAVHLERHGGIGRDGLPRREHVRDLAAGHEPDQLRLRGLGDMEAVRGAAAVLDDGDAVPDLADLLQAVRDVDDGDALGRELADHPEQVLDLAGVQDGTGLIHDDQLGVPRERAGHADDLLVRGGERADLPRRGEAAMAQPLQEGPRGRVGPLHVQHAPGRPLVAQEDVLRDGQPADHVELLVHRGDAEVQRCGGALELDGTALPEDLALIRSMYAGERLDEGGLAGPVLAHDAVDLSGTHVEVDSLERLDGGEALGESAHLQQRRRLIMFRHVTKLTHYVDHRYKGVDFSHGSVIVTHITSMSRLLEAGSPDAHAPTHRGERHARSSYRTVNARHHRRHIGGRCTRHRLLIRISR
ncbi:hypothetical protein CITRIK5_70212 [Citricoccus sp. K5]|nr:hypothetical protein CITRIK5_70212 [Citricoccus sp. K5]